MIPMFAKTMKMIQMFWLFNQNSRVNGFFGSFSVSFSDLLLVFTSLGISQLVIIMVRFVVSPGCLSSCCLKSSRVRKERPSEHPSSNNTFARCFNSSSSIFIPFSLIIAFSTS